MSRTVGIPFTQAKEAAKAVLPHVPKDDVNAVLGHAVIRKGVMYATDRYTIIEHPLTRSEWREDGERPI